MSGPTPPCPTCGKEVETFGAASGDIAPSMVKTSQVLPPAEMWVNPCGHRIAGYVATEGGIVVEWKP